MMTPQELGWFNSPNFTRKLLLTFKLMQLENARITFEEELRNLTAKVSNDVRDFISSSRSTDMFGDIEKSLDSKYKVIQKLFAVLPKCTTGSNMSLQPYRSITPNHCAAFSELLVSDAVAVQTTFKKAVFKPTLFLGMKVSLPQEQRIFYIQPKNCLNQRVVSRHNVSVDSSRSSAPLKTGKKESTIAEEEFLPDVVQVTLVSAEVGADLVPNTPTDVDPEVSDAKPLEDHQVCNWKSADAVQVQHQIQTSCQLLHFFRNNARTSGPLQVTVVENSGKSRPGGKIRVDESTAECSVHPGPASTETHAPVFRVKSTESTGFLTYSCVIASSTELWDITEICMDVRDTSVEGDLLSSCQSDATDPQLTGSSSFRVKGFSIPNFEIRNFEETEVVVSHMVNPGNFYIQNVGFSIKHQSIFTGVCKSSSSYAKQNLIPDIGTKVMCWFPEQEQWCRAQVTKICGVTQDAGPDESTIIVEVRRLDYGDTSCLSLWNIHPLTSDMATLPLQALKVSLANVTPVNGTGWSEEAVAWFKEMTLSRILYARFYSESAGVTVELFLGEGKLAMRRGASLSLRLAQNGHATHSQLTHGRPVKKSHQLEKEKQTSEWEKYLISCYAQRKCK